MTDHSREDRVLRERAARLARVVEREGAQGDRVEIAVCTVGDEKFGFPVTRLREIVPLPAVTRLPFAPESFLGIAQIRGTLLSVVDLARLCGVKGESRPEYVAVLEGALGPVAFAIDTVKACERIALGDLVPGDAPGRAEGRVALGLTRDLVLVLDVPRLLDLPGLVIA